MADRGSRALLCAIGVLLVCGAGPARADSKKPGMFDFETWKSPVRREREAAGQLAPGQMDLSPAVPHTSEPRVIRVRVYADSDYRGLVVRWQGRLRAQIERVNAVAGPVFNVNFAIESARNWDRSHVGIGFDAIGKELTALDAAREVDLVLGLVTPARGVATDMHQVGQAATPGRYIVLRGLDDEQEGAAIDRNYALLSAEERSRLYSDRKAHKEVVVFLHEWGHSAGLLHEEDPAMIMNPVYDPKQAAFSDFDKEVLALVIDRRLGHRDEALPERAELLALFEKAPPEVGSDKDRAQLLTFLRAGRIGQRPSEPRPVEQRASPPPADTADEALVAARDDHPDQAWRLFSPRLQRLREGGGSPEAWTRAAQVAVAIGALSAAEEAIGHVARGGAEIEKVAADVELIRQRVALPPARKSGLAPAQEPAYVAAFRATAKVVTSGSVPDARARLQSFSGAFPDSAGADLLACELEVREKHAAVATQRCEAALAKSRYAERAHVLLGLLAARAGHAAVAEQHFQAAIHMDAQDTAAWQALARLFRSQRAGGRLDELAHKYQTVFGAALPE
ncbi:MAG TPA: matrixin family metalloprotease [Polyangia bacterium]|nr:matrixin family metalloprotease [Polyangia bacterium]